MAVVDREVEWDAGSTSGPLAVDAEWLVDWSRPTHQSVIGDPSQGPHQFDSLKESWMSGLCWNFGRSLADAGSPAIGLLESDHVSTRIEEWLPPNLPNNPDDTDDVPPTQIQAEMYISQIEPLAPLGLRGVTWYQGESDFKYAQDYGSRIKLLVKTWRDLFRRDDLFFGAYELAAPNSPQIATAPETIADAGHAAFAPTADCGIGGYMAAHPPDKAEPARRMAVAARAVAGGEALHWKPPSYDSLRSVDQTSTSIEVVVDLKDLAGPLEARPVRNYWDVVMWPQNNSIDETWTWMDYDSLRTPLRCDLITTPNGCGWPTVYLSVPATRLVNGTEVDTWLLPNNQTTQNASLVNLIRGAELVNSSLVNATLVNATRLCAINATLAIEPDLRSVRLAAEIPDECSGGEFAGTSHATGSVPLISTYDSSTGLPLAAWEIVVGDLMSALRVPAWPPLEPLGPPVDTATATWWAEYR